MELRRLSFYLALLVLAICSQSCSDAHSMHKRNSDDLYDDDTLMGDEASDDEAQNDGNDADDEDVIETILSNSTTYTVTVGKTIRLECIVSPNNNPVVQWLKNGEPLFMGTASMIQNVREKERFAVSTDNTDPDHYLLISNLAVSDSGNYTCKVIQYNSTMLQHQVVVVEAARIISFTATGNGVVTEGSDILLTCNVAGSPPPQILWSFTPSFGDGMNVRLTEKDATFTLNSAFIRNVSGAKTGRYYCYAMNSAGSKQSELNVTVLHKPTVHVHKTVVNSKVNITALLQCSTHGAPVPEISWYKDGHVIDAFSPQYTVTRQGHHSNLSVTPQDDRDFGTFTCVAQNTHGRHNKSIELVQRPVVEDLNLEGHKLSWTIRSHQPLENLQLEIRDTEGNITPMTVQLPQSDGPVHKLYYLLDSLSPGTYEVVAKAKNSKEWSTPSEPIVFNYEVDVPAQSIQTASVYHGNSHSIRPGVNVIVSTVFMYLLVRLF